MRSHFFLLLTFLFFNTASSAELIDDYAKPILKEHVKPTLTDGLDRNGLYLLGGGLLSAMIVKKYDQKIHDYIQEKRPLNADTLDFGNWLTADGHVLMISTLHSFLDTPKGIPHLESYLTTGLTVEILKNTTNRTRPNGIGSNSFPSGHIAVAFTSATALTYGYGLKAAIPAYTLASITFLARLQSEKHYMSDAISGALIGVFWARSAHYHHYKIMPIVAKDNVEVRLGYSF